MTNEFLKGVLDAKLSALLTESDYAAFAALGASDRLSFFINNNLVSTNIVTNFEALSNYVLSDLKNEISTYLPNDTLYVPYFFSKSYVKKEAGARAAYLNKYYDRALKKNDSWLLKYIDLTHSVQNVLTVLRAKKRGDDPKSILTLYLNQRVMSDEVFAALVSGDRANLLNYVKSVFNVDLEVGATNEAIETILDHYVHDKISEFATEGELIPTLIYYIKMKEYELFRLRELYYAGGTR